MSSLDKLAIRGIRSFDDKKTSVIQFYNPVTVIVGVNGSGKTTIIECLKYATTGELPPNTKGGAFIHDPKMAGEKEVKAQVRLRFYNVKRERMTATRNLQVTVKKAGGLTMKTLEGVLAKVDLNGDSNDKRNAISTKCAEMDIEVPRLMGVSKAILENVIFCHQEESNWPLSEPSALKKKFDDIFEASKFTKALDHIKTIRKERTAELKVEAAKLEGLKKERDRAEKLRSELKVKRRELDDKEVKSEELQAEALRMDRANQSFYQKSTKFTTLFETVSNLNAQKKMQESNLEALRKHIKLLKESDEDLRKMLVNFERDKADKTTRKEEKLNQKDQDEQELAVLRSKYRKLMGTLGELEADRKRYENNVEKRLEVVRAQAIARGIEGYHSPKVTPDQIKDFCQTLQELSRVAKKDAEALKIAGQAAETEINQEINNLKSKKESNAAIKADKQRQLASFGATIRQLEDDIDSISTLDVEVRNLQQEIDEADQKFKQLTTQISEAKYEERLRNFGTDIRFQESQRQQLDQELLSLQGHGEVRAKLGVKRDDLQARKLEVEAAVDTHGVRFQELIGSELKPDTMEEKVTSAFRGKEAEISQAEMDLKTASDVFQRLQSSIEFSERELKAKEAELSRSEKAINDAVPGGPEMLHEELKSAEDELEYRQAEKIMLDSQAQLFIGIKSKAAKTGVCAGCNRQIKPSEKAAFETYVEGQISKGNPGPSARRLKELTDELESWKEEAVKLRSLLPVEETIQNLRTKILPDLRKQLKASKDKVTEAEANSYKAKDKVSRLKASLRDINQLKTIAIVVTRNLREAEDITSEISGLERDLDSTGTTRTIQDVQREIKDIMEKIKAIDKSRQETIVERDGLMVRQRSAESTAQNKKLQLSECQSKLQKRRDAKARVEECKASAATLRRELEALENMNDEVITPLRQLEEKLKQEIKSWTAKHEEQVERAADLNMSYEAVNAYTRELDRYMNKDGDKRLRDCEQSVRDLDRQVNTREAALADLNDEISKLSEQISQSSMEFTNLAENLRYREAQIKIEQLTKEIESYDLNEAHLAKKQFDTKYEQAEKIRLDKHGQHLQLVGEISQIKETVKSMENQLKQYADVQANYVKSLVTYKTGTMANNDLEKYGKALDNAIMKYHSLKMEEINATISHLWTKTYQGSDIDVIKIRSDHDEASTSARKTYNYRVVMVKDTVELDMRGRCSAGQKVLASIIIRLALADSFATSCGILALDEPTTSLDSETVEGLAVSLTELINERQRQNNFQLVVITHDEAFLQKLASNGTFDFYWRVSRDRNQKSIVERQRAVAE